jgi:hypothetical protein
VAKLRTLGICGKIVARWDSWRPRINAARLYLLDLGGVLAMPASFKAEFPEPRRAGAYHNCQALQMPTRIQRP